MYKDYTAFCTFIDLDKNYTFEISLNFTSKDNEVQETLMSEVVFFIKMRRKHHNQNVHLVNNTVKVIQTVPMPYIIVNLEIK